MLKRPKIGNNNYQIANNHGLSTWKGAMFNYFPYIQNTVGLKRSIKNYLLSFQKCDYNSLKVDFNLDLDLE